ncbi:MAG: hypothetical protein ACHQ53_12000 [Polyangiales bacterium]
MRWLALLVALLGTRSALADDAHCGSNGRACACTQELDCFALWYTAPGAVLGVKTTASHVQPSRRVEAGVLTSYTTELYATRRWLTGHLLAFGSLGGGTAGTEGSIGGSFDFGWRAPVRETSGPFARAGVSGVLLGHDRLRVSLLEPVQGRLGYQFLDGDALIETGFTTGYVALGRYEPGLDRSRRLSSAMELGGYVAAHTDRFRVDAALHSLGPSARGPKSGVSLVSASVCAYPRPLAVCAELWYMNAVVGVRGAGSKLTSAVYSGLTLGFTP